MYVCTYVCKAWLRAEFEDRTHLINLTINKNWRAKTRKEIEFIMEHLVMT